MRVVLVCKGAQNIAVEALAPALKKRGHEAVVVFDPGLFDDKFFLNIAPLAKVFDQSSQVIRTILDAKPDLVGFSVMSALNAWALDLAGRIKRQSDVPIVFGGIHPTSAPEATIAWPAVDFVIQGEADEALPDLADAIGANQEPGKIPNVWTKKTTEPVAIRPLIEDLDSLGPMDKSVHMESCRLKFCTLVSTSRGCPYACAYCCHSFLKRLYKGKGRYLRRRSVEAVIEECEMLKKDYDVRLLSFMDDVFTVDPDWLERFAGEYQKRVALPFLCNVHTQNLSLARAQLLKDTGCIRLDFGVQSVNEKTQQEVLHRKATNQDIRNAFDMFDQVGLPFYAHHIFGLPNDTEADYIDAARFYLIPKRLEKINNFFLSYFPGTDIVNYALENELLTPEQVEALDHGENQNYYQGGTMPEASPEKLSVALDYAKLYVLIPMMPKRFSRWILDTGRVRMLRFIPGIATLVLEVILVFVKRNARVLAYMRYYSYHIGQILRRKLAFFRKRSA